MKKCPCASAVRTCKSECACRNCSNGKHVKESNGGCHCQKRYVNIDGGPKSRCPCVKKEAGYNSCTGCKNPIESTKANLDKCVVWLTRVDFIIQPPLKIWLHAKTWERFKQSGKSCNCGILQLRYKRQFCISLYRNCGINKKKRIQNSTENGLVFVENQTYLFINVQMNNFFLRSDFCNEDMLSPDAVFSMRFLYVFSN